jgi:predicted aspartyl protease
MTTIFLRIGSALLVASSVSGSMTGGAPPTMSSQKPVEMPPPAIAIPKTPIEIVHGKPFVTVMVNGQGPFRFVIDTGTSAAAFVSPQLAEALSLPQAGETRLTDPSKQNSQRLPVLLIRSLKVAGVEFNGIKAVRHTLDADNGACDGVLGFALFRSFLLTLDYPHRNMTLSVGALTPDGGRSVLPFRMPDGTPLVRLRIGNLAGVEAQIDSGGSGLSLPQELVAKVKFSSGPEFFGVAQTLSSKFQLEGAQLASDISLGGYTFKRPFVEINPAFPLVNFGGCPMQNFSFTFDQKNGLVRIAARQPTLHLSATPFAMRPDNAPSLRPRDPALIPAG